MVVEKDRSQREGAGDRRKGYHEGRSRRGRRRKLLGEGARRLALGCSILGVMKSVCDGPLTHNLQIGLYCFKQIVSMCPRSSVV